MADPYTIVATPNIEGVAQYPEGSEIAAGRVTEIRTAEGDLILLGYVPSPLVVRAISALPVFVAELKRARGRSHSVSEVEAIDAALDLIQPRTPT